MKVELGDQVMDIITGFSGTVVGHVRYLTGCNQVLVVPRVDKDGKIAPGEWFDEQRVRCTSALSERVTLDNGRTPGSDRAPPRRV